jgi:hypothetical protein
MGSKKVQVASATPAESQSTDLKLNHFLRQHKTFMVLVAIGFLGGVVWFIGMRFLLVSSPETHYHANFAVYIKGVREDFTLPTYYEEVAACTSSYVNNPKGRVHMHGKVNDVIHVHDKRVTYGHFFQNIGWNVGDEYIASLDALYQSSEQYKLRYFINGKEVDNITNRVIGNLDKLLVSYDTPSADLADQINTVTSTANKVNEYQDPAGCGGLNGAGYDSFGNRV